MNFQFLNTEENYALTQLARLHGMTEEAILRRALYRYNNEVFGIGLEHMFPHDIPASKIVEMDEWFGCINDTCPLRTECAQHHSAGDYRSDGGIRPMLVKLNDKNEVSCCTNINEGRNLGIGFIWKDAVESTEIGCIVYSHPRKINGLHET